MATRGKIEPVFTLSLMEKLLCRVRFSGTAPLAWHHSSGAPLQKSKQGGPQGKESGARVTFCGQTVLQSSTEDEEGHVGHHLRLPIGSMDASRDGGESRQSSSGKSRHGGWNVLV